MSSFISIITAIHMAALSQIESGDRDEAVGRNGELSRYQVMPSVAMSFMERSGELRGMRLTVGWEQNRAIADRLARAIWQRRLLDFQMRYHRNPSITELYLCWHRPGRPTDPTTSEYERACRFANVVHQLEAGPKDEQSQNKPHA